MLKTYTDPYLSLLGAEQLDSLPEKQPKFECTNYIPKHQMFVWTYFPAPLLKECVFGQPFLKSASFSEACFACPLLSFIQQPIDC